MVAYSSIPQGVLLVAAVILNVKISDSPLNLSGFFYTRFFIIKSIENEVQV